MAEPGQFLVRDQREHFRGPTFRVVTDQVEMPDGQVAARDYLHHIGAVAVVALDPADQVVLVRQYRHPLRRPLWELPAGLVDVAGETLPQVAARELAEEADLAAGQLDRLLDLHPSPGCSDERIAIFLARDLTPTPHPHARTYEEATMTVARFPLDHALRMIFDGEITNAACVAGLLATDQVRRWERTRPPAADGPRPDSTCPADTPADR